MAFFRLLLDRIDRLLGLVTAWGSVLVLPLSLLLFLQWPLREIVQHGSREANDLAQILFALYVSIGISAATRARVHLAADVVSRRYTLRLRDGLARAAALIVLLPWSAFLLWFDLPVLRQSWHELEAFAETLNPGYFLVKSGVALLSLMVALQAILDAFRQDRSPA